MAFEDSLAFAQSLDKEDPLAHMRQAFHIPRIKYSTEEEVYFCGNSLGLQPKLTSEYLNAELSKWQKLGVKGHFDCEFPWMPYHEFLADESAKLVGAHPSEVVCMNSLTANLHFMMVSFYRPSSKRYKILLEDHAFPSDHYAVESQVRFHGYDPSEAMVLLKPRDGEECLHLEDILSTIDQHADELALIMLPGVQYYTGQVFDMQAITDAAQHHDITVGFDLAHAAGNIEMQLHDWGVDFAAWCTYKYLNSGPGSVAGCFVHEKHHDNPELPRFAGWWGHDKNSRFEMENEFIPIQSAEGWQLSNPPILSLAAIRASLDTIKEAGGIAALRNKSKQLTAYLRFLLHNRLAAHIDIITPDDGLSGCQLSICVNSDNKTGKQVFAAIEAAGVTCDWRAPNVIRVAPVPLYNSYEDCIRFVDILEASL
ncbi:kynureninase [Marinicella sp. S1101]|uniref:kynureninase n=1 Tax=Marinicella marina TaxID=2996016 RepID=UPI00226086DA|nr:kynureninase [Marinicella marina]MCX7553102.1 kynureninase [Marinicella marina]MDJ1138834.1 kynureninase [Marinicella marina]